MKLIGLDEKDNQIAALLRHDARMTYSDIGAAVGLSRTAVKTRVSALEKSGIIKGYHAVIESPKASEMMTFVVNIETKPENFEEAKTVFAQTQEVVTLVQTTGSCHLLAICVSASIQTMRDFVKMIYQSVPGILSVNTHAVLDIIKGDIIPE